MINNGECPDSVVEGVRVLSNVNYIQNVIMQLEGGAFQKLFDEYLYKKYKFKNIQTLGVQTGTNKPTKGTPDSYVLTDDGKYILINYGSVSSQPEEKIRADILSCFNKAKLSLPTDKIKKIICGYCSTNIHIEQFSDIMKVVEGVKIELIGIDTLSHWMQLHEDMRKAGFYMKTVEESCERFVIIDQEIVWYGNINLLAKSKIDDSIMRVRSKEIASELMEITFGDNGGKDNFGREKN